MLEKLRLLERNVLMDLPNAKVDLEVFKEQTRNSERSRHDLFYPCSSLIEFKEVARLQRNKIHEIRLQHMECQERWEKER